MLSPRLALACATITTLATALPVVAQGTQDCTLFSPCTTVPILDRLSHELCVPDRYDDLWELDDGAGGRIDVPAHYLLQRPVDCDGGDPRPLLVLFRGVGTGAGGAHVKDCDASCGGAPQCYDATDRHSSPLNETIMLHAAHHGWYVLVPLGVGLSTDASLGQYEMNYGVPQAILNIEHAMEQVLTTENIDRTRIYGVGFSMGGMNALAYAARHLDPESDYGMFAGLAILAGNSANSYRWAAGNDTSRPYIQKSLALPDYVAGQGCASPGSPDDDPLVYQASSGVWTGCDVNADPQDADGSLVWNLRHLRLRGVLHQNETRPGIIAQMGLLDDVLSFDVAHPDWIMSEPTLGCEHCWDLYLKLNTGGMSLFQFFEQQSLCDVMPSQARVLVPEDTYHPLGWRAPIRYFFFEVDRDDDQVLGDFTWQVKPVPNKLILSDIDNLLSLRVRTETSCDDCHDQVTCACFTAGLDPTSTLRVQVYGSPGLSTLMSVTLEGYASAPSRVSLDVGAPFHAILRPGQGYYYDGPTQTLELVIPPIPVNTSYTWTVRP